MQKFLQRVAYDLWDKANGDFQHVIVVFPNKRAALFFNRYLWDKSGGCAMWSPQYTTITELFSSMTDMQTADPVYLVCQLYETFLKHFTDNNKSFDELYPLLEMMLADFQDVDSNMVEADKLFRNVKELQDLSDYSFLEPEQIAAIQHFFNGLNWQSCTKEQQRFVTLWDKLLDIYNDFRKSLLSQTDKMVYEGLLKRTVIEGIKTGKENEACAHLSHKLYVFVGFNVLNKTEQELFRFIKRNKQTLFYWDYDEAFMAEAEGINLPLAFPGSFIKENIRIFGNALHSDDAVYHNMRARVKEITFIQSPTDDAQARFINEWANSHISHNTPLTDYSVVLCNESLLQSALHSIPSFITTQGEKADVVLNVTMGYPLSETPAYSLVQALLDLQLRGRTSSGAWRYKQTAAVLKHPYIRKMSRGQSNDILAELASANIIFPTDSAFEKDEMLHTVFTKHNGKDLTKYLVDVLAMASGSFTSQSKGGGNWDDVLYKESIFIAYTLINRLHGMQESIPSLSELADTTTARLVNQALQRATVPFHGEPADGLQVMGFLETRNLDFSHVILLSANDDLMPHASKRPSLIPYSLKSAFGMTTIDREVSIYAYYFYRLIARAESITILWNSSTEGGHKGEMSRFMMQMMCEAERLFHPEQKISLEQIHSDSASTPIGTLSVEKNDEIMRRLHQRFDIATEQTEEWQERHKDDGYKLILSPSAINCYLRCQMQFFFKYVARLRPDDDISEEIDDAIFGDIFHYAMENLYKPYTGMPLTSARLHQMANDNALLHRLVDKGFMEKLLKMTEMDSEQRLRSGQINYSGAQLIKHYVLRTLLKKQILADAHTAEEAEQKGGHLRLLATEEKLFVEKEITPSGSNTPFTVRLGGIIDRIDEVDNGNGMPTIRVVDYKTSASPQTVSDIAQLFGEKADECYHITQTLYYCDVICDNGAYGAANLPVVPAIMYYKNNISNESPVVKMYDSKAEKRPQKKPYIESYVVNCRDDFRALMYNVIEEMFSPGAFTATENEKNCKFCDFKQMCRKRLSAEN